MYKVLEFTKVLEFAKLEYLRNLINTFFAYVYLSIIPKKKKIEELEFLKLEF